MSKKFRKIFSIRRKFLSHVIYCIVCVCISTGCPENVAASVSGSEVMMGTDVTCTSTGGNPDPTYRWLDQDGTELSATATVTIPSTPGVTINYTCVATSTYNGRQCTSMVSLPATIVSGSLNVVIFSV